MPYIAVPDAVVGEPVEATTTNAIIDNQAVFNDLTASGSSLPPNGSFEFPEDVAGATPSSWTEELTGDATGGISLSSENHGKQSYEAGIVSGGDTVTLTSNDELPVAPGQRLENLFWYFFENATMDLTVKYLWWYWTGSQWSAASDPDTTVFNIASGATSWTPIRNQVLPPTTGPNFPEAYTIEITFGGTVGNSVFIDGMQSIVYKGLVRHGKNQTGNPLATITTNVSTTITVPASIITLENPNWAMIYLVIDWDNTLPLHSMQNMTGGVFDEISSQQGGISSQVIRTPHIFVPLTNAHQFKIVTTGGTLGSGAGTDVYLVGFMV